MSRALIGRAIGAIAVIFGLAATPQAATAAPILQIDGSGILTGVNGVLVGSNSYNVSFADGSCATVFGVCDAAHFTFTSSADANAASFALMDAIESPIDFDETKIFGCGSPNYCLIFTPFFVTLSDFRAWTIVDGILVADDVHEYIFPKIFPWQVNSTAVFAVWTVPEPTTLPILGVGLLALVFMCRWRKAKA